MVIARLINLNVSCKLHPYFLQRTRSTLGPRLPKRIGNSHPRHYYNPRVRIYMYIFFFKLRNYIVNWITMTRISGEHLRTTFNSQHNLSTKKMRINVHYGIYCWWHLKRSKQLSCVSVCHAQVFAGFSGHGNSINNIIFLLKK